LGILLLASAAPVSAKDLTIDRAALHQIEDGPPIDSSIHFLPGETVYWSFHVSGFASKEKDEEFRSLALSYQVEVLDPKQIPAIPPVSAKFATDVRREDKDWTPKVRGEIRLPDFAARGKYKVLFRVTDAQSGEVTMREMGFTVLAREVAPAAELTIRNFGFYQTEDSPRPLTEPVYPVGGQVWTRFDIVGYETSPPPKNGFEIEYGLTVTGPDDKAVISQPKAATEKYENFYPRRFLPAGFRLDLPKDGKKGRHELVLEIRDQVSGKKLELRREFLVE
jgi:hypothetical protein